MSLGAPGALWWLAAIPLVVILYMLRARREPRVVPSVLLWERAARDLVARLPMRRLERSLLLLLQILAIALIALALARPLLALRGLVGDAVVFVVDMSASMQATDVAPTRLAAAQQEAINLLGQLGPRQPAALVAAGLRPRLVAEFSTDRRALAGAVRALAASDAAAALDEAVALAAGLRAEGRPAVVHVFADQPPHDPAVRWHRIGVGAPNAGITVARTRRDARGHTLLMVRVEAFGGPRTSRAVIVNLEGREVARREISVAPGRPQTVLFDLGDRSGIATVALLGRDALPADDRAAAPIGHAGLPRVLVTGEPNPVLDAVLAAVPTAGVTRSAAVSPEQWGRSWLVVLDRVNIQTLPPGAYLLIGTLAANLPMQIEGSAPEQTIRTVTATHPVTRLVDLRGVRVAGALALRPQAGRVLAEGDVPLIWVYEGRGLRAVVLPFDLMQSDLAVHPAFPVLIANTIAWLAGSPEAALGDAPVVAAGEWRRATVLSPGDTQSVVEARDGVFVMPAFDRVGAYTLRTGSARAGSQQDTGWERRWVVPTADAGESALAVPAAEVSRGSGVPVQIAQLRLTPWLLGLAALLLAGEWWLWARTLPRRRWEARAR
ncbi:MAG: vWA domain-containing protein [Armatimonadota bacterium]